MEVKFDKNIPIPPKKGGPHQHGRYHGMEIGDSVFLPIRASDAFNRFASYCKLHGWKITTRTVTEDGVKGARVWRIE